VVSDCYNDVYRFALSLTKAEADAVDLTQNAFLKYAKKGSQVRDPSKVKSWLFSVARNEFMDIKRKQARFPTSELEPGSGSEEPQAAEKADGQLAMAALQEVPDPYREPLSLYFIEGYTYNEIAGILGVPIGTVMSRLSRGKQKLKAALSSTGHPRLAHGHG
jgi:RNA polymerase sigma-70 factor (ECF subfamily)